MPPTYLADVRTGHHALEHDVHLLVHCPLTSRHHKHLVFTLNSNLSLLSGLTLGQVYECFFLGGLEKTKVLKAFRPHIFFDDQDVHLEKAAQFVPVGKVLYTTDSPLGTVGNDGDASSESIDET
ncbi:5'-nucleotidase [Alicyclobacillus macrosporangiidus]|uniref:5'-nucleotidase n=1 Tax=Alicyclobacillus macrosporangiidus TaxID=392015 RepID=UPI0009DDD903